MEKKGKKWRNGEKARGKRRALRLGETLPVGARNGNNLVREKLRKKRRKKRGKDNQITIKYRSLKTKPLGHFPYKKIERKEGRKKKRKKKRKKREEKRLCFFKKKGVHFCSKERRENI